jgi:putative addiction module killer protein
MADVESARRCRSLARIFASCARGNIAAPILFRAAATAKREEMPRHAAKRKSKTIIDDEACDLQSPKLPADNLAIRAAIFARVRTSGSSASHSPITSPPAGMLREGVSELRIDFGPGYRVYYAMPHRTTVLLLCGGDKRRQSTAIDRAIDYWQDYQQRTTKK